VSYNPYAPSASVGATLDPSGQGIASSDDWAAEQARIGALINSTEGYERWALEQKYADSEKGRQNALQLEQMRARAARYGVDAQTRSEMAQLAQRAKEFEANHDLDVQKFGLSQGELTGYYQGRPTLAREGQQLQEAQYIAQQRSQPNRLFQTMDLEQALGAIRGGRPATQLAQTGVSAVDGLSTDYTGNPYLAGGAGPLPGPPTGQSGATTGAAPDPRLKALNAVMTALPPSATEGLDPNAVAALNAAYAIYKSPGLAKPGSIESLSPTQKATFASAGERLQGYTGRSPDDFMAAYRWNSPGMGGARLA